MNLYHELDGNPDNHTVGMDDEEQSSSTYGTSSSIRSGDADGFGCLFWVIIIGSVTKLMGLW
jgi:hypothetical protein